MRPAVTCFAVLAVVILACGFASADPIRSFASDDANVTLDDFDQDFGHAQFRFHRQSQFEQPFHKHGVHIYTDDWDRRTSQIISSNATIDPNTSSPVPEPSSLLLLGTGILGVAASVRRKLFG